MTRSRQTIREVSHKFLTSFLCSLVSYSIGLFLLVVVVSEGFGRSAWIRFWVDPSFLLSVFLNSFMGVFLIAQPSRKAPIAIALLLFSAYTVFHIVLGGGDCGCLPEGWLTSSQMFGLTASLALICGFVTTLRFIFGRHEVIGKDANSSHFSRLGLPAAFAFVVGCAPVITSGLLHATESPPLAVVDFELTKVRKTGHLVGYLTIENRSDEATRIVGIESACSFNVVDRLPLLFAPHEEKRVHCIIGGRKTAFVTMGAGEVFVESKNKVNRHSLPWIATNVPPLSKG